MSEGCSAVKRFGESCPKNNNCTYPQCLIDEKKTMVKKIGKGTHDGVFDWILESDSHAAYPDMNSAMIRVLVQEHNKLIDELERQYQKGYEHGYDNGKEDAKIVDNE